MDVDLKAVAEHDLSDDCPACRAQEVVEMALVPAASAWEAAYDLPRYAMALHGAAGLLGVMLGDGVPREEIEAALAGLLDEIEDQIEEERVLGGPPQGTA